MTYLLTIKATAQLKVLTHLRHSRHPKWLSVGVSAASTSWTQSERTTTDYPTVQRTMLFKQSVNPVRKCVGAMTINLKSGYEVLNSQVIRENYSK